MMFKHHIGDVPKPNFKLTTIITVMTLVANNICKLQYDYDYDYEITLFEHKQNQHIHIIIVQ